MSIGCIHLNLNSNYNFVFTFSSATFVMANPKLLTPARAGAAQIVVCCLYSHPCRAPLDSRGRLGRRRTRKERHFSGVTKGEEHPCHPPRAVEGEDVPKATRNLTHGQSFDLRKRIVQEPHLASGQKTGVKKGLPRQGAQARTPPGQGRGHPLGAPSGCSRAAFCGLL